MQIKKAILAGFLLLSLPAWAQQTSLQPGDTVTVDLDTGSDITQWIKEAREINPYYMPALGDVPAANGWIRPRKTTRASGRVASYRPLWLVSLYGIMGSYTNGTLEYENMYTLSLDGSSSTGGGAAIMRQVTPSFALGVAYERDEPETLSGHWPSYSYPYHGITATEKGTMERLLLVGRLQDPDGLLYIPFGAGYGGYQAKWTVPGSYLGSKEYHGSGFTAFLGLGMEFRFNQHLSFSVEGRYHYGFIGFTGYGTSHIRQWDALGKLNIRL